MNVITTAARNAYYVRVPANKALSSYSPLMFLRAGDVVVRTDRPGYRHINRRLGEASTPHDPSPRSFPIPSFPGSL